MTAVDRVIDLLWAEGDIPLAETLLLLAESRPGAGPCVDPGLAALDRFADGCADASIDSLVRHLFVDEGFIGDRTDYHDPRNSYLDEVLTRRAGMPITLAVVLVETARRLGIKLYGVGMPGHFLVRELDVVDGFIDPFHGGVRISAEACHARFRTLHGADAQFDPSFLAPVPSRSIVQRVLNNLTVTFRSRTPQDLDWLLDIRIRIPAGPPDLRALSELCELRGRFGDAADLLDRMEGSLPDSRMADDTRDRALRLRARLN